MNIYPSFAVGLLDDDSVYHVDMNTDDIRMILLNGYTYNSAHDYLNDVTGSSTEIARASSAVANPTVTGGVFDHDNKTITSVPAGNTITDVVYYKYNASDASAILICHIDQDQGGSPMSLATNGSDVLITPHASGVFDIV
jgi:hypothetical protein